MEASLEIIEFRYLGTLLLIITVISLVILINQIYHTNLADKFDKLNQRTINSVITDRSVSSIMSTCVNKSISNYYVDTHKLVVNPEDYPLVASKAVDIFYELASTVILDSIKDYTINEKSYLQALAESTLIERYSPAHNNSEEFMHYMNS